jgi:hypothetical protein
MEAIHSSETLVLTRATQRHTPEDGILQFQISWDWKLGGPQSLSQNLSGYCSAQNNCLPSLGINLYVLVTQGIILINLSQLLTSAVHTL